MTGTEPRVPQTWLWGAVPLVIPVLASLILLLVTTAVLAEPAPRTPAASLACSTGGTGATVAGVDLDLSLIHI